MEDVNIRRRIFLSLLYLEKVLKNSTPGELPAFDKLKGSK